MLILSYRGPHPRRITGCHATDPTHTHTHTKHRLNKHHHPTFFYPASRHHIQADAHRNEHSYHGTTPTASHNSPKTPPFLLNVCSFYRVLHGGRGKADLLPSTTPPPPSSLRSAAAFRKGQAHETKTPAIPLLLTTPTAHSPR